MQPFIADGASVQPLNLGDDWFISHSMPWMYPDVVHMSLQLLGVACVYG
jgi:hypothetical protein